MHLVENKIFATALFFFFLNNNKIGMVQNWNGFEMDPERTEKLFQLLKFGTVLGILEWLRNCSSY